MKNNRFNYVIEINPVFMEASIKEIDSAFFHEDEANQLDTNEFFEMFMSIKLPKGKTLYFFSIVDIYTNIVDDVYFLLHLGNNKVEKICGSAGFILCKNYNDAASYLQFLKQNVLAWQLPIDINKV